MGIIEKSDKIDTVGIFWQKWHNSCWVMSGTGAINAQVRRQTQYNGDRPLKLTTYRDSEIDEKTIQLLKVR